MSQQPDYYANHRLKLRFPWSLYHAPIVRALARSLQREPNARVLNIGSGPFFEFERLPQGERSYVACDIDARAVELARARLGSRLKGADSIQPDAALPYEDGSFDVVISTEVIEHVPSPDGWLKEALRVVRPGGRLVLTTPNYGSVSLRALEATALEVAARLQGFTREGIHPNKLNARSARALLERSGAVDITVRTISLGWVLLLEARKP